MELADYKATSPSSSKVTCLPLSGSVILQYQERNANNIAIGPAKHNYYIEQVILSLLYIKCV